MTPQQSTFLKTWFDEINKLCPPDPDLDEENTFLGFKGSPIVKACLTALETQRALLNLELAVLIEMLENVQDRGMDRAAYQTLSSVLNKITQIKESLEEVQ